MRRSAIIQIYNGTYTHIIYHIQAADTSTNLLTISSKKNLDNIKIPSDSDFTVATLTVGMIKLSIVFKITSFVCRNRLEIKNLLDFVF